MRRPQNSQNSRSRRGEGQEYPWIAPFASAAAASAIPPDRISVKCSEAFDFKCLFNMQFPPFRLTEAAAKACDSSGLPIQRHGCQLLERIRANLVTIITGPTGCGKTTIVPLLLFLQHKNARILVALPRRMAVQMAAEKLKELLGETELGEVVGYHVGQEDALKNRSTRLLFVTAGMLRKYAGGALRELRRVSHSSSGRAWWRELFPYDFVIVDEVHERSVDCDMALLLVKALMAALTDARNQAGLLQQRRNSCGNESRREGEAAGEMKLPLFRLIVMSATIRAQDFAVYLSSGSLNRFLRERDVWEERSALLDIQNSTHELSRRHAALMAERERARADQDIFRSLRRLEEDEPKLAKWTEEVVELGEQGGRWAKRCAQALSDRAEKGVSGSAVFSAREKQLAPLESAAEASLDREVTVQVAGEVIHEVEDLFLEDIQRLARVPFERDAAAAEAVKQWLPVAARVIGLDGPFGGGAKREGRESSSSTAAQRDPPSQIRRTSSPPRDANGEEENGNEGNDDEAEGGQDAGSDDNEEDASSDDGDFDAKRASLDDCNLELAAQILVKIHLAARRRGPHMQPAALVFLPGKPEIERMRRVLDSEIERVQRQTLDRREEEGGAAADGARRTSGGGQAARDLDVVVLSIHRDADAAHLREAKTEARPGCLKVILATNIAESSVTFRDVGFVLDFALAKEKHVHFATKTHRLKLHWASRAALQQRRGRTGRTREGVYFCFLKFSSFLRLPVDPMPELQRLPLEDVLMDVLSPFQGGSSGESLFLLSQSQEPPSVYHAHDALSEMEAQGALHVRTPSSSFTALTGLGSLSCELVLPVKATRLILLGAALGVFPAAVWAASLLLADRPLFLFSRKLTLQSLPVRAPAQRCLDGVPRGLSRAALTEKRRGGFDEDYAQQLLTARCAKMRAATAFSREVLPRIGDNSFISKPNTKGEKRESFASRSATDRGGVGNEGFLEGEEEFPWGSLTPCDICTEAMWLLFLERRFGSEALCSLDKPSPRRWEKLSSSADRGSGFQARLESRAAREELFRFLRRSGCVVSVVGEVSAQKAAICRKLFRGGPPSQLERLCRWMPSFLRPRSSEGEGPRPSPDTSFRTQIEAFVWRLQLALALASFPFGFCKMRNEFRKALVNAGAAPRPRFAFNVVCRETLSRHPNLKKQLLKARAASASPTFPICVSSGEESLAEDGALLDAESDGSSSVGNGRPRGRGSSRDSPASLGCLCGAEGPFLGGEWLGRQIEEEEGSRGTVADAAFDRPCNARRWSLQLLKFSLQELLRGRCSSDFKVQLLTALLKRLDDGVSLGLLEETPFQKLPPARPESLERRLVREALISDWLSLRCQVRRLASSLQELEAECRRSGRLASADGRGRVVDEGGASPACRRDWRRVAGELARGRRLDSLLSEVCVLAASARNTRRLLEESRVSLRSLGEDDLLFLQNRLHGLWRVGPRRDDQAARLRFWMERLCQTNCKGEEQGLWLKAQTRRFESLNFFGLRVESREVPLSRAFFRDGWHLQQNERGATALLKEQFVFRSAILTPLHAAGVCEVAVETFSARQVEAKRMQRMTVSKRARGLGKLEHDKAREEAEKQIKEGKKDELEQKDAGRAAAVSALGWLGSFERVPGGVCKETYEEAIAAASSGGVGKRYLLSLSAAYGARTLSAFWRVKAPLYGHPSFQQMQIVCLGDALRRTLFLWLHRQEMTFVSSDLSKRMQQVIADDVVIESQPRWASALPLVSSLLKEAAETHKDQQHNSSRPRSHHSSLKETGDTGDGAGAETDRQKALFQDQLKELGKTCEAIREAGIRKGMGVKARAHSLAKLLFNFSAKLDAVEEAHRRLAQQWVSGERTSRQRESQREKQIEHRRGNQTQPLEESRFERASKAIVSPAKTDPFEASENSHCQTKNLKGEKLQPDLRKLGLFGEKSEKKFLRKAPWTFLAPWVEWLAQQRLPDASLVSTQPYRSAAESFLREFLSLQPSRMNAEDTLREQPSCSRSAQISGQSILHSGGPFYPSSQRRSFLALVFSEWETTSGGGPPEVAAASLLPPLPQLEEVLLLVASPLVAAFLFPSCACFCCGDCVCSTRSLTQQRLSLNPRRASSSKARNGDEAARPGGGEPRAESRCCALCLRGKPAFFATSFGGQRDFGFVPSFLWKAQDLSVLNKARGALHGVLRLGRKNLDDSSSSDPAAASASALGGPADSFRDASFVENNGVEGARGTAGESVFSAASFLKGNLFDEVASAGEALQDALAVLLKPPIPLQERQRQFASATARRLTEPSPGGSESAAAWQALDSLKRSRKRQAAPPRKTFVEEEATFVREDSCSDADEEESSEDEPDQQAEPPPVEEIALFDADGNAISSTPSSASSCVSVASRTGETTSSTSREHESASASSPSEAADSLRLSIEQTLKATAQPETEDALSLPEAAASSPWGIPAGQLILQELRQKPSLKQQKAARRGAEERGFDGVSLQCGVYYCRMPLCALRDLRKLDRETLSSDVYVRVTVLHLLAKGVLTPKRRAWQGVKTESVIPTAASKAVEGVVVNWLREAGFLGLGLQREDGSSPTERESKENWKKKALETDLWLLHRPFGANSSSSAERPETGRRAEETASTNASRHWMQEVWRSFPRRVVPVHPEESTALMLLSQGSPSGLHPSTVAIVKAYLPALVAAYKVLSDAIQQQRSQTEGLSPEEIAKQNRHRDELSARLSQTFGWELCPGPLGHVVGIAVGRFVLLTPDFVVDVAGHLEAQSAKFWKQVSAAASGSSAFLEEEEWAEAQSPRLSLAEALALSDAPRESQDPKEIFAKALAFIRGVEDTVSPEETRAADELTAASAKELKQLCECVAKDTQVDNPERFIRVFFPFGGAPSASSSQREELFDDVLQRGEDRFPSAKGAWPSDLFGWQEALVGAMKRRAWEEARKRESQPPRDWQLAALGEDQTSWTKDEETWERYAQLGWRWASTPEQVYRHRRREAAAKAVEAANEETARKRRREEESEPENTLTSLEAILDGWMGD